MNDEVTPDELLDEDHVWLFRGMFLRSPDDDWMLDTDEIEPLALHRLGKDWRDQHSIKGDTETAYTAWSTNRDTAEWFGGEARDDAKAPGKVVVFMVRLRSLTNPCFRGRDTEDEVLIEGTVENVELSTGDEEEDQDG